MRLIDADLLEPDAEYDDGEFWAYSKRQIEEAPTVHSASDEIIYCKDCRKHNISPKSQEDCCPLYHYRGMSFGSEHDLQFCSYAERKTDGDK